MKKLTFLISFLLIAIFTSSCSKDTKEIPLEGKTISVSFTVSKETQNAINAIQKQATTDSPETRVAVTEENAPKFLWKDGEQVPLKVLIKQAGAYGTAIADAVLTVKSDLTGTFKITLPGGYNFDPARGNMLIAAATGKQSTAANGAWATALSTNGEADITSTSTIDCGTNQYNIPLYFELTPVRTNGTMTVQFKMYGSLVAFKIQNTTGQSLPTTSSVTLASNQLGIGGKMNIATLLNGIPTWTGNGTHSNTYNFSNLSIPNGATKFIYAWVKQEGSSVPQINLTYTDVNYKTTYNKTSPSLFQEGNSYRLSMPITTGKLMITEFYLESNHIYNWIELYNPGYTSVSTTGYQFLRKDASGNVIGSPYNIDIQTLTSGDGAYTGNGSVKSISCFGASSSASGSPWSRTIRSSYAKISSNTLLQANPGEYIYLLKDGVVVDVIKVPETYLYFGAYSTRKRNENVNTPNPIYTAGEWTTQGGNVHSLGQRAISPTKL